MINRYISITASLLLCLALASCSSSTPAVSKEAPIEVKWPFYKIEKDQRYMYLLGTIHIGKREMYPFPEEIVQAVKKSRFLVTETDAIGLMNGDYQKSVGPDMFFLEDNKRLEDYLSEDAQAYLKMRAKEYDIDYRKIQTSRLWNVISLFQISSAGGFTAENGVDQKITELAHTYIKTNKYLETPKFQIEALQKVYPENEADQIIKQIPPLKESKRLLSQLYTDYIQGNMVGQEEQPENVFDKRQMKILNDDRNKVWVKKFETYIGSGDIYFVAVGAAHLGGENGILSYFEKKGYNITKQID